MQELEIEFLRMLRAATEAGKINWELVKDEEGDPNDDRAIYRGLIGDNAIEIELVSFQVAYEKTYEVLLARINGLKTFFEVSVGTEGFSLVSEIISHPKSIDASKKNLKNAIERVQRFLADSPQGAE